MTTRLRRDSFRAMGTSCAIAVTAAARDEVLAARALDAARREIARCEVVMTRFDASSDLCRMNRQKGSWVKVDVRLVDALAVALQARVDTDGRFDPTMLRALAAAGYDRSFELLEERPATPLEAWHAGAPAYVDVRRERVRVAPGAAVDLGGIGKGFAASRALRAMRAAWPALRGALIDLGGDIAVVGCPPGGGLWKIDIADPRSTDGVLGTLEVTDCGIATSGRDTRRFGPDRRLHHLIDPSTGAPAIAGPLAATVVAATAPEAEAHATALALLDADEARSYCAARPGLSALLVPHVGEPIEIGNFPRRRARAQARLVITTQQGWNA